ncbi:damage-inducible type I toxin DinQ [Photorhabdus luminescens]
MGALINKAIIVLKALIVLLELIRIFFAGCRKRN